MTTERAERPERASRAGRGRLVGPAAGRLGRIRTTVLRRLAVIAPSVGRRRNGRTGNEDHDPATWFDDVEPDDLAG